MVMPAPHAAVAAVGVVVLRLLDGVEAPPPARVGAAPGDVEPVGLVAVHVVVHQLRFKPRRARAPVAPQVVDEVAGHHLAQAVAEVACGSQLAHGGIDQGLARIAPAPAIKTARVVRGGRQF